MERILDLKTPPVEGEWYWVPVWPMRSKENNVINIPIIGHAHTDHEIGVHDIEWHWHIDRRFISDEELIGTRQWTQDRLNNEYSVPVLVFQSDPRPIEKPDERTMKCLRSAFPVSMWFEGGKDRLLLTMARDMRRAGVKLDLNCKTCPHKGTSLSNIPVKHGLIQCPAHGLRFHCETGEIEN